MRLLMPIVLTVALGSFGASAAQPLTAVPSVDMAKYAGTWYEQARMPMYFQRKCVANTTATYALLADGQIRVENRCHDKSGNEVKAIGVARPVPGSSSKLKVRFAPGALSFLPFVWADYWVVDLDPAYRWAVVGEPGRKYLWVLSRDKNLPEEELKGIVARVRDKGFDIGRLLYTAQK